MDNSCQSNPKNCFKAFKMAGRTGLEPATPCVTGRYSNQLNYRPLGHLGSVYRRDNFITQASTLSNPLAVGYLRRGFESALKTTRYLLSLVTLSVTHNTLLIIKSAARALEEEALGLGFQAVQVLGGLVG